AGDSLVPGEVLGRLPHRDVDVRQLAVVSRVVPILGTVLGTVRGALFRVGEQWVVGVGQRVGVARREPGDRFDSGRDDHVPRTRADRVHCHPGGLQAGGAVTGDRGAGQMVVTEFYRDRAAHVESRLAPWQATAEHQIVDLGRVELGYFV